METGLFTYPMSQVRVAHCPASPTTSTPPKNPPTPNQKIHRPILHTLLAPFASDELSPTNTHHFSPQLLDQITHNETTLTQIHLAGKGLKDTHIKGLCEALIRNRFVTVVSLTSNRITDEGAMYIAHMLKFNHGIEELYLGENDIGPKGAAALASGIAEANITLLTLDLKNNHIGVEGAGAFAASLCHNRTLRFLDLSNNGIPKHSSVRELLRKMLESNARHPENRALILGLREELNSLLEGLPPDMAEDVVLHAEEALKMAMVCRRRGDALGAAEAESNFIRICTKGEAPLDPPEEMGSEVMGDPPEEMEASIETTGDPREKMASSDPPEERMNASGDELAEAVIQHENIRQVTSAVGRDPHNRLAKPRIYSRRQSEPDRLDELNDELKTLTFNVENADETFEEVMSKDEGNMMDRIAVPETALEYTDLEENAVKASDGNTNDEKTCDDNDSVDWIGNVYCTN